MIDPILNGVYHSRRTSLERQANCGVVIKVIHNSRTKNRWHSALVLWLVFILAGLTILTGSCSQRKKDSVVGIIDGMRLILPEYLNQPLKTPFLEIIPSSEDIARFYEELEVVEGHEPPQTDISTRVEATWPSGDGEIHARIFNIKHRKDNKQIETVSIALFVEAYVHEAEVIERYQNLELTHDVFTSAPYKESLEPNPDDAFSYTYETDNWQYHGPSEKDWVRKGIVFRVGHYLGWYQITEYDPPAYWQTSASGIYDLSFHLWMMLKWMTETTISKLQVL